ncbi:hypothetical protein [Nocardia callitridis]
MCDTAGEHAQQLVGHHNDAAHPVAQITPPHAARARPWRWTQDSPPR